MLRIYHRADMKSQNINVLSKGETLKSLCVVCVPIKSMKSMKSMKSPPDRREGEREGEL